MVTTQGQTLTSKPRRDEYWKLEWELITLTVSLIMVMWCNPGVQSLMSHCGPYWCSDWRSRESLCSVSHWGSLYWSPLSRIPHLMSLDVSPAGHTHTMPPTFQLFLPCHVMSCLNCFLMSYAWFLQCILISLSKYLSPLCLYRQECGGSGLVVWLNWERTEW